ncbi:MAG: hypothetical protein PF495_01000 [Spirochaetales bacterium]|nr:hypothetical protein [Spirochaetales bacterium]
MAANLVISSRLYLAGKGIFVACRYETAIIQNKGVVGESCRKETIMGREDNSYFFCLIDLFE